MGKLKKEPKPKKYRLWWKGTLLAGSDYKEEIDAALARIERRKVESGIVGLINLTVEEEIDDWAGPQNDQKKRECFPKLAVFQAVL